ncbi:MAG: sulfite exporter TauE/SafE family protein [Acidimicrobiales bacterium]|nr:sulfite exporter TauE/SafE family protein [Acidimicrobiales bacterium]
MDPGPLADVLTVLLGVATGVLSGAFGVGGAVISTPGIRLLGASALVAIGTTLPSIIPSSVSGTIRYRPEGLIAWKAVAWTAPTGIAAAVGGALLSPVIPGEGHWLMVLTALLLGYTAFRMGRQAAVHARAGGPPAGPPAVHDAPGRYAAVGVVAGLLSGLLGIGGGVVMVPGFNQLAGMPLKAAIATSLVCVGIFAVPGTITHAALGNIDWRFALLLAVGVIPGARLGAALAVRAADQRLRLAVAGFLGLIALLYAGGELAVLFG